MDSSRLVWRASSLIHCISHMYGAQGALGVCMCMRSATPLRLRSRPHLHGQREQPAPV